MAPLDPTQWKRLHELKLWPAEFSAAVRGHKPYEVRKHDRPYMTGDFLLLREWRPSGGAPAGTEPKVGDYTGRSALVRVLHMTCASPPSPLPDGICVLGIEVIYAFEPAKDLAVKL